jgi:hypothetical protein
MANTLGFQLYSLKDYEGGWAAAVDAFKGLGIDTIEAWCGRSLPTTRAPLRWEICGHLCRAPGWR